MTLSTPLKDKDKSPTSFTLNSSSLTTPKPKLDPSKLSISSTPPFTEGRTRRTAAAKADKYIDIVSRRLDEVPANGSTPKSMKIASKLISEATPNTRRTILLAQSLKNSSIGAGTRKSDVPQDTPNRHSMRIEIPEATPVSARKRKRTAKINQLFETSLMSLASAASLEKESVSAGLLSPTGIGRAPGTISKSRLNQVYTTDDNKKETALMISSTTMKSKSPVKENSPLTYSKASLKSSPSKKVHSPMRRSQRLSPSRVDAISDKATQKSSTLKEPKRIPAIFPDIVSVETTIPASSIHSTPKAPFVEYVAPQSALRTSKRPRKLHDTSVYNDEASARSPVKQNHPKYSDSSVFPTVVSINSQSRVKLIPQTPIPSDLVINEIQPQPQFSSRISIISSNVPTIIVPLSAAKQEDYSSNDDLSVTSKRTPLRVQQPSRTPTRTKSAIPSLSDYSAATKFAVIEVAKNSTLNNNISATPKVEPWSSKYLQKEAQKAPPLLVPAVNLSKTGLNVNIKPVDTSKISGYSNGAIPIVPKFPLNLSSISNITKASTIIKSDQTATPIVKVPESPLTRAKRIDSENSHREEKIKIIMDNNSDRNNKFMPTSEPGAKDSNLKDADLHHNIRNLNSQRTQNQHAFMSSKLPIKPKTTANNTLPNPKIPSRLAEAFSGIDSELPPIDIGLVDDEKILKKVLNGSTASESAAFVNPKMKKQPAIAAVNNNNNIESQSSSNSSAQLHRTAVLNSAARKVNAEKTTEMTENRPVISKQPQQHHHQQQKHNHQNKQQIAPNTPKPSVTASKATKLDTSSPLLPEIPSE